MCLDPPPIPFSPHLNTNLADQTNSHKLVNWHFLLSNASGRLDDKVYGSLILPSQTYVDLPNKNKHGFFDNVHLFCAVQFSCLRGPGTSMIPYQLVSCVLYQCLISVYSLGEGYCRWIQLNSGWSLYLDVYCLVVSTNRRLNIDPNILYI